MKSSALNRSAELFNAELIRVSEFCHSDFYILKYYNYQLSDDIKGKICIVKELRDAICHRSSSNNWLNNHIKLQGGLKFKQTDVAIEYGSNSIDLINSLIELCKHFRKICFDQSSNPKIPTNEYQYNDEENNLTKSIDKIKCSIQDFIKQPYI